MTASEEKAATHQLASIGTQKLDPKPAQGQEIENNGAACFTTPAIALK